MKALTGMIIIIVGIAGLINYAPSQNSNAWIVAFLWIFCFLGLDMLLAGLTE